MEDMRVIAINHRPHHPVELRLSHQTQRALSQCIQGYHDLRHPMHTRQLEPLQFVGVLAIGKAVALVRSLGAALSVNGMFSLPVQLG
ncbi:unnamed protein product [Boreogadus saida]